MSVVYDHEYHENLEREKARKTKCSECGKRVKPSFKSTPDPLEWFFPECVTCEEVVCDECSFVDEKTGVRQCYTCYEASLHKKVVKS